MATGAEPTNLVQRTMSGSTRIRPSDCDPGALITDEYPGVNLPAGPPNACVTGWHAAASASASARLSATAAASAAACAAVSPGSARWAQSFEVASSRLPTLQQGATPSVLGSAPS